jgi:hypothetical protein
LPADTTCKTTCSCRHYCVLAGTKPTGGRSADDYFPYAPAGVTSKVSLQETQPLPRVPGFAEGFLSGPRQRRKCLPRAALGTAVLTTLHHLPRVGPSAGCDSWHNHVFAERQPSARSAPSEKERAPSHLGCRPLCRRPCADGSAVRPSAQMQPVPSAPSPALGKGVDPGLTRLTSLC